MLNRAESKGGEESGKKGRPGRERESVSGGWANEAFWLFTLIGMLPIQACVKTSAAPKKATEIRQTH